MLTSVEAKVIVDSEILSNRLVGRTPDLADAIHGYKPKEDIYHAYDEALAGHVLTASEFLYRTGVQFDHRQKALVLAMAYQHKRLLQPPSEGVYDGFPVTHLSEEYFERLIKMRQFREIAGVNTNPPPGWTFELFRLQWQRWFVILQPLRLQARKIL